LGEKLKVTKYSYNTQIPLHTKLVSPFKNGTWEA